MKVAIAILRNEAGEILLTQRPPEAIHGGFWEFPGGKLNQDETPLCALVREIDEELSLKVIKARHLGDIDYRYSTHAVTLMVFDVLHYTGTPVCQVGQQDLQWVSPQRLMTFRLLEANQEIIDRFIAEPTLN